MANLDRSLDDMIKSNQSSRTRAPNSGPGPNRRFHNRSAGGAAPYPTRTDRAPKASYDHSLFTEERAAAASYPIRGGARVSSNETGTKLLISNLDHGVTDEDIRELFSGVGDLKTWSVHYDRSGRSEGTAEVVFSRRVDAETAIKRFNHVQLDGKPMKIDIVGAPIVVPPPVIFPTRGAYRNNRGAPIRNGRVQERGGGSHGMRPNRGSGGARNRVEKVSAEDLDAELEKYHAQKKETD